MDRKASDVATRKKDRVYGVRVCGKSEPVLSYLKYRAVFQAIQEVILELR
jgi:hypothetical protein